MMGVSPQLSICFPLVGRDFEALRTEPAPLGLEKLRYELE